MKIGGQIPWNAVPICETFKISCLMGRLHTKGVLENHSKDQSLRLVHNFIFPAPDGRIKLSGGDDELRTPTLIRDHPIRGEDQRDFLGESKGSLPPPQDSLPDAGEAINDFWSMSGNFIFRHHVEPRVKLYSLREELFPIPLKYLDVSRTTRTNLNIQGDGVHKACPKQARIQGKSCG